MTTIAFRGGLMACDSRWTMSEMQVVSALKIQRLSSGALLGQAGDNDARAVAKLFDKVRGEKQLPSRKKLAATLVSFHGLLALPNRRVFYISIAPVDEAGWPLNGEDIGCWPADSFGYCAVGSGSHLAMGAMAHGASAEQAVAIACRHDPNSALPVHVMSVAE